MLTVTEAAAEHLAHMLDEAKAPNESAIRFVRGNEGVNLKLDTPVKADETFEHAGRTVLVIDDQMSQALTDKTLDVNKSEQGMSLVLK